MDPQTITDETQTITDETDGPLTVAGPDGQPLKVGRHLWLGVEKFRRPRKHYRLIYWQPARDRSWLCEEDETHYRRKSEVERAALDRADKLGIRFRT